MRDALEDGVSKQHAPRTYAASAATRQAERVLAAGDHGENKSLTR
jgi:hypothetical protein